MKKLTDFFKQIPLRQILTVFLATVVLFVSTACNNGDIRGARPDNPPVQMGGSNNPYKSGGDNNTNFNLSPDPKVNSQATKSERNRADVEIISNRLIANQGTLYPGAEIQGLPADEERSIPLIELKDFEQSEPGGQIQRESSFGERVQDRLGVVKETFGKASEFITQDAEEALERHEEAPTPGLD
jgi:hypothetical protein